MTNSVLSDLQERIISLMAEARNLGHPEAQALIDAGPHTALQALARNLVDGICYEDELSAALTNEFPGIREISPSKLKTREGFLRRILTFYRPQIAYIVAEGIIAPGESRRQGGSWPLLGCRTLKSFLRDARRRKRVKAIVLRINSPGGSSLASDLLWREVKSTNQSKPLIVSLGDVAASGGYYIASAAGRILGNPSTLTGSIGVIGGKFSLEKLLAKLGVSVDAVEKGAHSGYASIARPFSEEEAHAIRRQMKEFYEELFLPKVAQSRGRNIEEVRRFAEGRVWTGFQAFNHGLLDEIGGIPDALESAQQLAELAGRKVRLVTYTQRRSLRDFLPFNFIRAISGEKILALLPEEPFIR
jgi:protease-4